MDRRQFIGTSLLAAVAGAYAAGAEAAQDPHIAWLKEWKGLRGKWGDFEDESPEEKALWKRQFELADLIAETPPKTKAGLLAQLEWLDADFADNLNTMTDYDVRGIIRNVLGEFSAVA